MNLLVYGTLRRFHHNHKAMGLAAAATYERDVRMPNMTLYNLGWFPGAVFEQDGYGVLCEQYTVNDPSILRALDRYEGYNPDDERGSFFYRRLVTTPDNEQAYMYLYDKAGAEGVAITSGDWAEHQQGKAA